MRTFRVSALLTPFTVLYAATAQAQCNPSQFTMRDIESLSFSDALVISAIDMMEVSRERENDRDFNAGIILEGVPLNVNYKEMKKISDYMKTNSQFKYNRDQKINWLRSAVSTTGAQMYESCLRNLSEHFRVKVPSNAYTEDQFILTLEWDPQYDPTGPGTAELLVLNGSVDQTQKKVEDRRSVSFVVTRNDPTKTLQIVPTIDGYGTRDDQPLAFPPQIELRFTSRLREWPETNDFFERICTDDGGPCGGDAKTKRVCLHADDGLFLPSTVTSEWSLITAPEPQVEATNARVCVTYSTYPILGHLGQKGYSAVDGLKFAVREVVPGQ